MTIDEFKKKMVKEHAGQFYRQDDMFIRHKTLKLGSLEISACPLAAVFGESYSTSACGSGMSIWDRDAIMDAADGYVGELRSWMLETLCT